MTVAMGGVSQEEQPMRMLVLMGILIKKETEINHSYPGDDARFEELSKSIPQCNDSLKKQNKNKSPS